MRVRLDGKIICPLRKRLVGFDTEKNACVRKFRWAKSRNSEEKNRHQKTFLTDGGRQACDLSVSVSLSTHSPISKTFLCYTAKLFLPGNCQQSIPFACFTSLVRLFLRSSSNEKKRGNNTCFMRFSFLAIRPISFRPFGLHHFQDCCLFPDGFCMDHKCLDCCVKLIEKDRRFSCYKNCTR